MAQQQSRLDVSKWQAARRQFQYTPVLWFYYRMIEVAFLDARGSSGHTPSDEALLARDWIARSEDVSHPTIVPLLPLALVAAGVSVQPPHEYVSFPECCRMLSLNADVERVALLELIDSAVDCDNDEAWERLEALSLAEPLDDVEPIFDAPRVVPALDQMSLFAA